jgi:hypothetical protein
MRGKFSKFANILITGFLVIFFASVRAQVVNPNNLPFCNDSVVTVVSGVDTQPKWSNCWGKIQFMKANGRSGDYLEGEWLNGNLNGWGIYQHSSGAIYKGELKNGKSHGHGEFVDPNGTKYVGEFKNDKRHGKGIISLPNGEAIAGIWENGKRQSENSETSNALKNSPDQDNSLKKDLVQRFSYPDILPEQIAKLFDSAMDATLALFAASIFIALFVMLLNGYWGLTKAVAADIRHQKSHFVLVKLLFIMAVMLCLGIFIGSKIRFQDIESIESQAKLAEEESSFDFQEPNADPQSIETNCNVDLVKFKTNFNEIIAVKQIYECFGSYNKSKEIWHNRKCLSSDSSADSHWNMLKKKYPQDDIRQIGSVYFVVRLNGIDYLMSDNHVVGSPAAFVSLNRLKKSELLGIQNKYIKVHEVNKNYLEAVISNFGYPPGDYEDGYGDRKLKLISCN